MSFWNYKDYKEAKRRGNRAFLIAIPLAVVLLFIVMIIVAKFF